MTAITTRVQTVMSDPRMMVLATIASGWFLILGMRFTFPTLIPQIKADFGIDNASAGLFMTVLWMAYGLTQFPAGLLLDKWNEKVVLYSSLLFISVGVVVLYLADTYTVFVFAIGFIGLGSGLFGTPRATILTRIFPQSKGSVLGISQGAGNFGAGLMPLVAGTIVALVYWKTILLAFLPFLLLVLLTITVVVDNRGFDTPSSSTNPGYDYARISTAMFDRRILLSGMGFMLFLFLHQGFTAFLVTYFIEIKSLSQELASGLFAIFFVTGAVLQPAIGKAADSYGDSAVLATTAFLSVLGIGLLLATQNVALLVVANLLLSTQLGIFPVLSSYIVKAIPTDIQGFVWGLLRTFFFVIGSLGSLVIGTFAELELFTVAFFIVLVGIVICGLIYLKL